LLVRFLDLDTPGGDFSAELQEQDTSNLPTPPAAVLGDAAAQPELDKGLLGAAPLAIGRVGLPLSWRSAAVHE
jgi:hypothetical protein